MNPKRILGSSLEIPVDAYALYLEKLQAEAEEQVIYLHHVRQEDKIRKDKSCKVLCTVSIPIQVQVLVVELDRLRFEMLGMGDMHTTYYYELMEKFVFVQSLIKDWLFEEFVQKGTRAEIPTGWNLSYTVGRNWKMLVIATNNLGPQQFLLP